MCGACVCAFVVYVRVYLCRVCIQECACVITHFFHSHGSRLQRVRGQWLVQGNDWGFKKFIRRGQCDDKLTLYCKVSSSHNSWLEVCSLLLCSLCLCTHITPIHTYPLSLSHMHTYTLNTHTCTHTTPTNTCIHTSTLDTCKYKHTHSTLTQVPIIVTEVAH